MTHDELLEKLVHTYAGPIYHALRAVVVLHRPYLNYKDQECFCRHCGEDISYPCPTIQAIEEELE